MWEAANRRIHPEEDDDLKRDVAKSLDCPDCEGQNAVLEFSCGLNKDERAEAEQRRSNAEATKLLDEWMADESGYAEESWPKS